MQSSGWKSSSVSLLKGIATFYLIDTMIWKSDPFSSDLIFWNKQKLQENTSDKYVRLSNTGMVCFAQNTLVDKAIWTGALSWWRIRDSLCWMFHAKSHEYFLFRLLSIQKLFRYSDDNFRGSTNNFFLTFATVFEVKGRPGSASFSFCFGVRLWTF